MNKITIKNSYLTSKVDISINGEPISQYSELTTISGRNFEESVEVLLKALDSEVFDDYEIDYYAMPIQYEILKSKIEESEYCKDINYYEITSMLEPQQLHHRMFEIGKRYDIELEQKSKATVYFNIEKLNIINDVNFETVEKPPAEIGIFGKEDNIDNVDCKVIVVVGERISIKQSRGRRIYEIPSDRIDDFWKYYLIYHLNVPQIMELTTALKYKKLNEIDKLELRAMQTGNPEYYLGQIPENVDKGKSYSVEFYSFPDKAFSLHISDKELVSYEGNSIVALETGMTELAVVNERSEILEKRNISVIAHQYATNIRIIPRFEYLKKNERNSVEIIVEPENAEDADDLIWEVDNPKILRISDGKVIALEEGIANVTITGKNTSSTITIEVKPELKEIRFEKSAIRLKNGETTILDCEVIPPNAIVDNLVWELDNGTIAAHNPSKNGRRCQIVASKSYQGKGNIRCYDANTGFGAICNLEVVSKVKRNAIGKLSLACMLLGIVIPFLLPVSIGASVYGLVKDEDKEQKPRYIIDAVISVLILIVWSSS